MVSSLLVGLGALLLVGAGTPAAMAAPDARLSAPPPTEAELAVARSLSRTFSLVAAQVSASVVRISVSKSGGKAFSPFRGTPLEKFFGDPDLPGPKQQGTGSGVVIDAKGYILTNNHVVEGADEVKVGFLDGRTVTGKVVGTDPKSDLAVVKVEGVEVRVAPLGDSDKAQIGEWVIAVGNPFGLDHTVTVGVLSAKNRSLLGGGRYEDFLQTDASINPGNSGGPLVNLDGEVIGINTMIAGIGTGIGFAVPTSMAKPIAEQLIRDGRVRRPYLGILMQDVTPEIRKTLGSGAPENGALVSEVNPDSPAEKAGVKPGDVIASIDGRAVDGSKAVQRTVLSKRIGQTLDLGVWRDGKSVKLSPTTGELPSDDKDQVRADARDPGRARIGMSLQTLTPEVAGRLGVDRGTRGVVVTRVLAGSPAEEAGMREKDVILDVNGKRVSTAEEAVRLLSTARPGGHLLRVKRDEGAVFVVIPDKP
jgi:serine protease Do